MGTREQNKARTRAAIADAAAALFAARGYEDVLVTEVARRAGVSEQTLYNYFPAKQDLVLDRATEIRAAFDEAVRRRAVDISPAQAIRPLVRGFADLVVRGDVETARGQHAALAVTSPVVRRFALEAWDVQVESIANVLRDTDPDVAPVVARAHAAALVSVVRSVIDAVGLHIVGSGPEAAQAPAVVAARIRADADAAIDDLDRTYHLVTSIGAHA